MQTDNRSGENRTWSFQGIELKKILVIQVAVLLVLAVVAILLATGVLGPSQPKQPPQQLSSQPLTQPSTQPSLPPETEPAPTEPAPTEPPVVEPAWSVDPEILELTGRHCFVYDRATDTFQMLAGAADDRMYPASVTKLFTAWVVLKYMDLDTKVTVGRELNFVAEDASTAGLSRGNKFTVRQLLAAMLLPSGNDAAYVLATATGRQLAGDPELPYGDAVARFLEQMNAEAQEQGLTGTHFANPDGYHHEDHYTTPADLLTIGKLSLESPVIMEIAGKRYEAFKRGGVEEYWKNSNQLVDRTKRYYCEEAVGLKTGFHSQAGQCLLAAFRYGDDYVLVGVFGCENRDTRFQETLDIWEAVKDALAEYEEAA